MFEVQGGIDPGIRSCSLMALEAKLIIGTLCGSDQTADANLWLEIRHLCILVPASRFGNNIVPNDIRLHQKINLVSLYSLHHFL